jgi:hypothetical protein
VTLTTRDLTRVMVRGVRLSNVAVGGYVQSAEISMSGGEHDSAVLYIRMPNLISYAESQRQLLQFDWGNDYLGRFYGYVTDVTPMAKADKQTITYRISAQGPTFVLKSGRPRFFTEATVADVVQRLAAEHQLGFVDEYGKEHYRWRQLAQTDESDWAFISDLCNRIGATLVCSHGVLRLIDPSNVLMRSVPLEYVTRAEFDGTPTVYDFTPTHYSDRLPTQFPPNVAYLNEGKVVVQKSQQTPTNHTAGWYLSNRPVRNRQEAELAQIRMPVDWEEQATVRIRGGVNIEPGTVLLLRTNRTPRRLAYDGYWYVLGVNHVLNVVTFQSQVDLARVTKVPRLPGVNARQWYLDPRGRPQMVTTKTGDWASTWR